jgi:hypothetical protein
MTFSEQAELDDDQKSYKTSLQIWRALLQTGRWPKPFR